MMAWADFDRDGDLDGYLLTNRTHGSTAPFVRLHPRSHAGKCNEEIRLKFEAANAAGELTMPG